MWPRFWPRSWPLVFALSGCATVVSGVVTDADGLPVSGATVHAEAEPPCDAVTDVEGRFQTRCPAGPRVFEVRHPALLPAEHALTVEGRGDVPLPPLVSVRVPTAGGVWVLVGGRFVAPPGVGLARKGDDTAGYSWCLPGEPAPAELPAGVTRMLDNHVTEWRLLRADAEGCVYRLKPTPGGFWEYQSDVVELTRLEPFAPGRDWLTAELTAGDYLLADWVDGGFVPETDTQRSRAMWVRVGG